jgi:23S rRNA (cytidine1920-2'-O)/16S rRNA (cytidine1409-2'-O)-methyltransferase
MDIGASTGGFSDCLLRFGAKKIYTIDVGYGQLDYKLRNNPKIVNIENTNARYITTSAIDDLVDIVVMDVSFISITKFDSFFEIFTATNNEYVGLIKPQFELSKNKLGKHGIVKESSDRRDAVERVSNFLKNFYNFVSDAIESPIKGSKGNTEYLIYCKNT